MKSEVPQPRHPRSDLQYGITIAPQEFIIVGENQSASPGTLTAGLGYTISTNGSNANNSGVSKYQIVSATGTCTPGSANSSTGNAGNLAAATFQ
jgi:hypothetical protein